MHSQYTDRRTRTALRRWRCRRLHQQPGSNTATWWSAWCCRWTHWDTTHDTSSPTAQTQPLTVYSSWVRARGTPAVDITAMTSSGHVTSSVTSPVDSARPLSYRFPIVNNPLSPVVYEKFSVKNGHGHARRVRTHSVPSATPVHTTDRQRAATGLYQRFYKRTLLLTGGRNNGISIKAQSTQRITFVNKPWFNHLI